MDKQETGFPLGELLDRCGHVFTHRFGRRKQRRTQLMQIVRENPGISQKELAERMHIQPASLSELVGKMEQRGLVVREKNDDDRRSIRIQLTETGLERLSQPPVDTERAFAALSHQEQAELTALLEKLLTAWEAEFPRKEAPPCDG